VPEWHITDIVSQTDVLRFLAAQLERLDAAFDWPLSKLGLVTGSVLTVPASTPTLAGVQPLCCCLVYAGWYYSLRSRCRPGLLASGCCGPYLALLPNLALIASFADVHLAASHAMCVQPLPPCTARGCRVWA
jgi:hypothetical protein